MKRVIVDCDPGIDDTFALIYLAAAHLAGEVEICAVTTTSGNVDAEQCAVNAAWVLEQCGVSTVPVAAGRAAPLEVALVTTPETHGDTGLGYVDAAHREVARNWEALWIDATSHKDDLQLIVTGPLTNAAAFARTYPSHFEKFSRITVMGGAVNYPGNTTPTAEWNFWVDPHAADIAFAAAPAPLTLCPLNLTEQMVLEPGRLEGIVDKLGGAPIASHLAAITQFYFEFHQQVGEGYCAQIHDLLTVLVALDEARWASRLATLRVETESSLTRGTVAADFKGMLQREPNARVLTEADIDGAWERFEHACELLQFHTGTTPPR